MNRVGKFRKFGVALFFTAVFSCPKLGLAADTNKGAWGAAMVGVQSVKAGGSISPISFGGSGGYKFGALGLHVGIIYGSKSESGLSQSATEMALQLDIFPVDRYIYFGPRAANLTLSVASYSASGICFGGGGGINIPVGSTVTIGVDASYVAGTINSVSVTDVAVLGNIKLWAF